MKDFRLDIYPYKHEFYKIYVYIAHSIHMDIPYKHIF